MNHTDQQLTLFRATRKEGFSQYGDENEKYPVFLYGPDGELEIDISDEEYYLEIGNFRIDGGDKTEETLERLEVQLFDWAKSEGFDFSILTK